MTESEHPPSAEKPTVFISDPSVEAERITQALRAAEFHVVDVPLAMLVARVAVQRPRVVILDADAEGALDAVARMRELPDAEAIDVLFCGRPGATLSDTEDALAHEGSGFFPRPVSVPTLLKKIESLASGVVSTPAPPAPKPDSTPPRISTRPPPADPPQAGRREHQARPSRPPSRPPSHPPPSRPPASRPPPSIVPSLRGPGSQRGATPSLVSRELAELLSRAEDAVGDPSGAANEAPASPEDEIEAVLPEDVLAALDAPLEDEEEGDEVEGPSRVTTSGGRAANTTGVREPPPAPPARPPVDGSAGGGTSHTPSVAPPELLTHDGTLGAHQTQGEPLSVATGSSTRTTDGVTAAHRMTRRSEPAPPPQPFTDAADPRRPAFGGSADASSAITTPPRRASSIPPPTHVQPAFSMPQTGGPGLIPASGGPGSSHAQAAPSVLSTTLGSELLVSQGGMIGAPVPAFGQPSQAQSSGSAPSTFDQPQPPPRPDSSLGPRATQGAYALGPGDAPRVLAQVIAERQTGALTFETPAARAGASEVRRIVLREGDVVTAASGVDTETLLAFLGARGDLPRERVEALAGRMPPYGRHAGAALVAQGALGQEQLWPVLRAHAEFIMGQAMLVATGTAMLEPEPPGRLKTEPSVFGGAPGAEIFVEVMRRVISSDEAVRRMGGRSSVVGEGARPQLLRECGLGAAEVDAVRTARGQRIDAITASLPDTDVAAVLYALWLLGVVDMVQSVLARSERPDLGPDVIDEEAVRERIRARLQLVEEGDYFALLGVPHNATGYEVKRAYLDLRRAFEPTRVLTPALLDLAEDVRRIAGVLEEAYEILGDNARRERYRRAIDASPAGG